MSHLHGHEPIGLALHIIADIVLLCLLLGTLVILRGTLSLSILQQLIYQKAQGR